MGGTLGRLGFRFFGESSGSVVEGFQGVRIWGLEIKGA